MCLYNTYLSLNSVKQNAPYFIFYRTTRMSLQSQQVSFSSSVPPTSTKWTPDSWRKLPIKQPPNYLDEVQVTYKLQNLRHIISFQSLTALILVIYSSNDLFFSLSLFRFTWQKWRISCRRRLHWSSQVRCELCRRNSQKLLPVRDSCLWAETVPR